MPTSPIKDETKILIDADVIRHFLYGGILDVLLEIFPNRLVLVDKVKEELLRSKSIKVTIFNFIQRSNIIEVSIEDNFDALQEYARLINTVDDGEAACMALARFEKKYIASSNLSDITTYCKRYNIKIFTTMDFLYEAIMNQLFSEDECDEFIKKVIKAGSKLPYHSIAEYVKRHKMS